MLVGFRAKNPAKMPQNTHIDEVDHFGFGSSIVKFDWGGDLWLFEANSHWREVGLSGSMVGKFQIGNNGVAVVFNEDWVYVFMSCSNVGK